ncbi:MAG: YhcH/YjgK/YiaL family protein [Clostridium sp.]|nr:YhcH/YjgK/YiaL family protein [Clostridium sp.]
MAEQALICLGSNMAETAQTNIDKGIAMIESRIGSILASSGKYDTPCYSQGRPIEGARYLNEVLIASSKLQAEEIERISKEIEAELGRNEETRRRKQVPIDIDLVAHGHSTIRPIDFKSPYFIKGYKKIMEKDVNRLALIWGKAPDASCDMAQWQAQYEKNKALWDELFDFLAKTDLNALKPGKVVISPNRLWINVMEYTPKDYDNTPAEAHKKYIDLQYTMQGDELMGLVRKGVEVTLPYDEAKDVEKYRPTGAVEFTKTTPDKFFLYFPSDIHQPSVASSSNPSTSHKIVCKIEYID